MPPQLTRRSSECSVAGTRHIYFIKIKRPYVLREYFTKVKQVYSLLAYSVKAKWLYAFQTYSIKTEQPYASWAVCCVRSYFSFNKQPQRYRRHSFSSSKGLASILSQAKNGKMTSKCMNVANFIQWNYLNKHGSRSHYYANFSIYHYTYCNIKIFIIVIKTLRHSC